MENKFILSDKWYDAFIALIVGCVLGYNFFDKLVIGLPNSIYLESLEGVQLRFCSQQNPSSPILPLPQNRPIQPPLIIISIPLIHPVNQYR
ncbi:MAG: hypothetical protein ACI8YQ_003715 [Polaribacter sp.]|jgi:hypothetical protein